MEVKKTPITDVQSLIFEHRKLNSGFIEWGCALLIIPPFLTFVVWRYGGYWFLIPFLSALFFLFGAVNLWLKNTRAVNDGMVEIVRGRVTKKSIIGVQIQSYQIEIEPYVACVTREIYHTTKLDDEVTVVFSSQPQYALEFENHSRPTPPLFPPENLQASLQRLQEQRLKQTKK